MCSEWYSNSEDDVARGNLNKLTELSVEVVSSPFIIRTGWRVVSV